MSERKEPYVYEYVQSSGLHLVRIEGKLFILDTGSPVSFTFDDRNKLILKTLPFDLPGNLLGIKKEDMDKLSGVDVAGFIGFDIIQREGLTIDKQTQSVMFEADDTYGFTQFPVRNLSLMGIGLMDMECDICGQRVKAIFDTGASIGYVHKSLIGDAECTGEIEDFGPSFGGEIKTSKYRMDVGIGDMTVTTELAKMTFVVESQVGLLGYKAILGLNDFEWERVVIDPQAECISFC